MEKLKISAKEAIEHKRREKHKSKISRVKCYNCNKWLTFTEFDKMFDCCGYTYYNPNWKEQLIRDKSPEKLFKCRKCNDSGFIKSIKYQYGVPYITNYYCDCRINNITAANSENDKYKPEKSFFDIFTEIDADSHICSVWERKVYKQYNDAMKIIRIERGIEDE